MKAKKLVELPDDAIDLTPMIDCVFLLLVYFLLTSDLQHESYNGITLPAEVKASPNVNLPVEHVVDIEPSGLILIDGVPMDNTTAAECLTC